MGHTPENVFRNFLDDADVHVIGNARGEYNSVVLLKSSSGKYVLRKKQKPVQIDLSAVAYEMEFMDRLRESQSVLHVPRNIPPKNGALLFEDTDAFYNLQTRVPGINRFKAWYDTTALTFDDIGEIFSSLAVVHDASRFFQMTNKKIGRTEGAFMREFGEKLRDQTIPDGPFKNCFSQHREFLLDHIRSLQKILHEVGYNEREIYPAHYDLNVCNMLWLGGKVSSIVDFLVRDAVIL